MDTNTTPTYDIWEFGQDITRRLFLQADELSRLALEFDALLKQTQKAIEASQRMDEELRHKLNKIKDERKTTKK